MWIDLRPEKRILSFNFPLFYHCHILFPFNYLHANCIPKAKKSELNKYPKNNYNLIQEIKFGYRRVIQEWSERKTYFIPHQEIPTIEYYNTNSQRDNLYRYSISRTQEYNEINQNNICSLRT